MLISTLFECKAWEKGTPGQLGDIGGVLSIYLGGSQGGEQRGPFLWLATTNVIHVDCESDAMAELSSLCLYRDYPSRPT